MEQTYIDPVEAGNAEAARLAAFRSALLARHGAAEPSEDEGPTPRGVLLLAVLSAAAGSAVTLLIVALSGLVRG